MPRRPLWRPTERTERGPQAQSYAQEVRGRAQATLTLVRSANQQIETAKQRVSATTDPGSGPADGGPGPAGMSAIKRYPRAASDGTALAESARLKIATAAVPYSTGKRVIAADRTGSDELPLRDLTLRIGTTTAGDVKIQGRDGTETTYTETDGVPVSSINLGSGQIVYKFGGAGVTFHDTQRRFDIGSTKDAWKDLGADGQTGGSDDNYCWQSDLAQCSAWNSDDLEITWQAGLSGSRNSPNGEPVYYWNSRVPFPEGQSASHPNLLPTFQNGRNDWDLGLYQLWVTNHGGYDRNLEPAAGKGQRSRADDVARYLKYAAYGVFVHTDTLTDYLLPSRVQAFHFGYDAFEDKEDKKTTDLATPIVVRFDGRTMGFMYQTFNNPNPLRVDIRGDVVLNARIGSGANTIYGQVTSLEKLSPEGRWVRFERAVDIKDDTDRAGPAGVRQRQLRSERPGFHGDGGGRADRCGRKLQGRGLPAVLGLDRQRVEAEDLGLQSLPQLEFFRVRRNPLRPPRQSRDCRLLVSRGRRQKGALGRHRRQLRSGGDGRNQLMTISLAARPPGAGAPNRSRRNDEQEQER